MRKLSYKEIHAQLETLPDWEHLEDRIEKRFSFDTYLAGIEFVKKIALKAEEYNHHPNLEVGWCQVKVAYTSHDRGGVTKRDIRMAKIVENLLKTSDSIS